MSTPPITTITPTTTITPPLSIQEQLLELKLKEQAFEQKQHEQAFQLKVEAFKLKEQAFELKEQTFEQKQKDVEQAYEQRQKDAEQSFGLKQDEVKLDLQRREDALTMKIERHTIDVQRDRTVIEQERLSAQQLKMVNEQERVRLLELEHQIESLLIQQQQMTGVNSIESFHMDNVPMIDQSPQVIVTSPSTTPDATVVEQELATLDLRSRQLKAVSKLIERRYDDALRKEYSNKQELANVVAMRSDIKTQRENDFNDLEIERKVMRENFENDKIALSEKIRSGQFDVLPTGKDALITGLAKYIVCTPERLKLITACQLNEENTRKILSMNEADFQSKEFQDQVKACQVLKLDHIEANRIISLPNDKWIADRVSLEHARAELKRKIDRNFQSLSRYWED